jgi:hypothetical protein
MASLGSSRWEAIPGAPTDADGDGAAALTVDKRGYIYWASLGCIYECVDGVTDRRPRECHAESDEGLGPVLVFKRDVGAISAMCTTPGGWICACAPLRKEVWLYSRAMLPDQCIATGIAAESCVCSRRGCLYLTELTTGKLWLINMGPGMDTPTAPVPIAIPVAGQAVPRSLTMSADQQTLYVAAGAATVWAFALTSTGSLSPAVSPGFYPAEPRAPAAELRIESMCVAVGKDGHAGGLLAATSIGLQSFDDAGAILEILPAKDTVGPSSAEASATSSAERASELSSLDPDERRQIADERHHRWAVEAPHCVTSVVIGPGAAAQWPHIEAGVKYDTSNCYVYATAAVPSSIGIQVWRR